MFLKSWRLSGGYGKELAFFDGRTREQCVETNVKRRGAATDIDQPSTWIKYHRKLCEKCCGTCCSLEVEVWADDLERMGLIPSPEYREPLKLVARKLRKEHVVERFHEKSGIFTLARLANGDCIFLNQKNRRCTIYENRPDTCRNHPHIGPRSGYCAFRQKEN